MGPRNRIAPRPRAMTSQIKSTKAGHSSHINPEVKLEISGRTGILW